MKKTTIILAACCLLPTVIISKSFTDNYYYPIYFTTLAIATVAVVQAWLSGFFLSKNKNTTLTLAIPDVLLAAWYCIAALSMFFSSTSCNNQIFITFTLFVLLYFAIRQTSKDTRLTISSTFTWILFAAGFFQMLYALLQCVGIMESSKLFSIIGTFGNPGLVAQFVCILSVWMWGQFWNGQLSKPLRYASLLYCIASLVLCVYVESRISVVATLVCYLFIIAKHFKWLDYFKQRSTPLKLGLIGIAVCIAAFSSVYLFHFKQDSSNGRLFIWKQSLQMIADHPVLGVGYGQFESGYNDYQAAYFKQHPNDTENAYRADNTGYAFNEYIQTAAESGILAAIAFVVLLVTLLIPIKKAGSESTDEPSHNNFVARMCVLAFAIIACSAYPCHIVSLFVCLFLFAAIASHGQKAVVLLSISTTRIVALIAISLSVILCIKEVSKVGDYKKWKEAVDQLHQGNGAALQTMAQLKEPLQYDKLFLFNFGAELSVAKQFDQSVIVLEQARPLLNDYSVHLYLGHAYEAQGMLPQAAACFEAASLRIPAKVYAKYRLFALHAEHGDTVAACHYAQVLVQTKIKGSAEVTQPLIDQAQNYLLTTK